MIIDVSVKERNIIDAQNNDIKKVFTEPYLVNNAIVGVPFTNIGMHMISLNDNNSILHTISTVGNILTWSTDVLYKTIKGHKKDIKQIKVDNDVISFTNDDNFNEDIMYIKDIDVDIDSYNNIKSFLSKPYDEYVLDDDALQYLALNTMYSTLDIKYNILRFSKTLIPTFKYTKKEISEVRVLVSEIENNNKIVKVLFVVKNVFTTSFHMYAVLRER